MAGRIDKLNHLSWEQLRDVAKIIQINPTKKVLDAGCGTGGIARFLASCYGANILAVDHSSSMIEFAKKQNKDKNSAQLVSFTEGNFPGILDNTDDFDIIFCLLWLAHMNDRNGVVKKFVSHLSGEGYFVTNDWLVRDHKKHPLIDKLYKGWHILPLETTNSFRDILIGAGLKIVKEINQDLELRAHWLSIYENLQKGRIKLEGFVDKKILDDYIHMVEITNETIEKGLLCSTLLVGQKTSF